MQRESMSFDVVIVGGGPAGLAAAIRLKQRARQNGMAVDVCLIEKSAAIGGHILSGALIDPQALDELCPQAMAHGMPPSLPVCEERFLFLSSNRSLQIPNSIVPDSLHNAQSRLISLASLCRWLATQAGALGVNLFPGFAGVELLYDENGAVRGIATGEMGVAKDGQHKPTYQPGIELHARYTLFAEGCRGQLGKQLEKNFALRRNCAPQTHSLGIKELWHIPAAQHRPGLVVHTVGWPLDAHTTGGGFMYHMDAQQVAVGFVTGLNYANPYLSPYAEFQRFKTHPALRPFLCEGQRLAYGARAIATGGLQSLPRLVFPGGALIGDDAGFLNAARGKGIHGAIKSGMLAADACLDALKSGRGQDELQAYPQAFGESALFAELYRTRNFKPLIAKGLYLGGTLFAIEQAVLRGKTPCTLQSAQADHATLRKACDCARIDYPEADGIVSFDLAASVYLSNTNHEKNQPCHLKLADAGLPIRLNLKHYDAPEQRYCPAGVFEIVGATGHPQLQINAQNCVHCKTCDIKDPGQNITWTAPQGGEGPNYPNM